MNKLGQCYYCYYMYLSHRSTTQAYLRIPWHSFLTIDIIPITYFIIMTILSSQHPQRHIPTLDNGSFQTSSPQADGRFVPGGRLNKSKDLIPLLSSCRFIVALAFTSRFDSTKPSTTATSAKRAKAFDIHHGLALSSINALKRPLGLQCSCLQPLEAFTVKLFHLSITLTVNTNS